MFIETKKTGKVKAASVRPKKLQKIVPVARPVKWLSDVTRLFGRTFVFDIECYPNYFLAAFMDVETSEVIYFEFDENRHGIWDQYLLQQIIQSNFIVGFNSRDYDIPVLRVAMKGAGTQTLKKLTNDIIVGGVRSYDIEKEFGLEPIHMRHVDLIEVCPLSASLKAYAGRLHADRMQELPYDPDLSLTNSEIEVVRSYCINDLDATRLIMNELIEQLKLRHTLTSEYGTDLMSKSDAQIAESVIGNEMKKVTGTWPKKPTIDIGTEYSYCIPKFIQYKTEQMKEILEVVRTAPFIVGNGGSINLPEALSGRKIKIGSSIYRMGIGGLHSSETCVAHVADEETLIIDRDVASYYPRIILNQRLYPKHLGEEFLTVYNDIVERRLAAKAAKNTVVADSLKIVINGSFGKFGSAYSILYSPDLLMQVTVTGQLSLLMLIESLELSGIPVISANTDGIVIRCPKAREAQLSEIIKDWEIATNFETEETRYRAVYSRDVNNYIAVKEKGGCKSKGAYSNPWADPKMAIFRFHKNPTNTICIEAAIGLIDKNIPIEKTIVECRDIRKFVSVRSVKGGAEKDGINIGKVVRWYYAKNTSGTINYILSGNKVPRSEEAKPLMDLPETFPDDVNFDWYIKETVSILQDIGFYDKPKQKGLFE